MPVLQLVKESPTLVVFFGDKANAEVLASLEGIDDDLDDHEVPFVMSDDAKMAEEFDIDTFPAVVAFQASMVLYRVQCVQNNFFKNGLYLCTTISFTQILFREGYRIFLTGMPRILKPY